MPPIQTPSLRCPAPLSPPPPLPLPHSLSLPPHRVTPTPPSALPIPGVHTTSQVCIKSRRLSLYHALICQRTSVHFPIDPFPAETPPPPYSMMETSPPEDVKPGNSTETLKLTFSAPHRGKFTRLGLRDVEKCTISFVYIYCE